MANHYVKLTGEPISGLGFTAGYFNPNKEISQNMKPYGNQRYSVTSKVK